MAVPQLCLSSWPQPDAIAYGFCLGSGSRVNAPIPMDSSAGDQSPAIHSSDNTDYPIPKDRYGDPITYTYVTALRSAIIKKCARFLGKSRKN